MARRRLCVSELLLLVVTAFSLILAQGGPGCQKPGTAPGDNLKHGYTPQTNGSIVTQHGVGHRGRVKRRTPSNGFFFPIAMYTVRHHRPINDRGSRTVRPESWEYRGQYFYGYRPRANSGRRRAARLLAAGLPLLLAPLLSILFSFPVVIPVAQMTTVTSAANSPFSGQYGIGRRRDRRRADQVPPPPPNPERAARLKELEVVSNYLHQVDYDEKQQSRVMVNYLQCNGLLNPDDHCLERLSCEFGDPVNQDAPELERTVTSILLGHMLNNEFLPRPFKKRLKAAAVHGRKNSGQCAKYFCHYVDNNWDYSATYPKTAGTPRNASPPDSANG